VLLHGLSLASTSALAPSLIARGVGGGDGAVLRERGLERRELVGLAAAALVVDTRSASPFFCGTARRG
jgi:hypothetical protein